MDGFVRDCGDWWNAIIRIYSRILLGKQVNDSNLWFPS